VAKKSNQNLEFSIKLIRMSIKSLISRNKYFYVLYYHLIRKNIGIKPTWFSKDTRVYYDGYPRSGNTFFNHIFRNVFKEIKSVHHLHKIAPVKIALNKKLPVIILIRNPKDAIASNYLKSFAMKNQDLPKDLDKNLLNRLLKEYFEYYTFIKQHRNKIDLVFFKQLIENPNLVFKKVSKTIGYDYNEDDLIKSIKTYGGASDKLGSSKPSEFKEEKKKEIKRALIELKKFKEAQRLFEELKLT
jgi:hypothetical protein